MPMTSEREKQKQVPPVGRNDKGKQVPPFGRNDKETDGRDDKENVGRDDKGTLPRDNGTFQLNKLSHASDRSHLWARSCATAGAAVWAGIAVLARLGIARMGAIELLFLFAPLVIVPLGLELGRGMGACGWLDEIGRRLQPFGAGLAVVALLLPPGRTAGAFATGWGLVCFFLAGAGMLHLISAAWGDAGRGVRATLVDFAMDFARIDVAVGGVWLVASRLGMRPMGIQEPIGLLTAVHFHFAGFATATIAAATLRFARLHGLDRGLKLLVPFVVGMPFVVAAGFVISPVLKMVAAGAFSVSVAGLAVFLRACGRHAGNRTARVLLQTSAVAVFVAMIFAGIYVVADFAGSDALTIPQMARTHGILNAVGFCLPGLLGWLVEGSGQRSAISD